MNIFTHLLNHTANKSLPLGNLKDQVQFQSLEKQVKGIEF